MKSLSTVARGAGFVFFGMAASKLLSYAYRVIVARIGPAEYGLLSIALAVFGIFSVFAVLGLDIGVVRYVAEYKSQGDYGRVKGAITGSLKITAIVSLLLGVLFFVIARPLATLVYHVEELTPLFQLLALMIPLYTSRDIIMGAIRAWTQESYFDVFSRNIGENVIKLAATFLLVAIGFKALGAIYATCLGIIITFGVSIYLYNKYIPWHVAPPESKMVLLRYSTPLLFSTLLTQVLVWSAILVLGHYRSSAEVGIYNAALPTATLLSIIPGGINSLLLPVMTELYTLKKLDEFRITYLSASKWIFFLNLPIFVAMVLFAEPLLSIIFGQEYGQGAIALVLVACSHLVLQTAVPAVETLKAIKRPKLLLLYTAISAVVNLSLNMLLIPTYGMMGGAIATAISFALYGMLAITHVYYLLGIMSIQVQFLKGIIAALVASSIGYLLLPKIVNTLTLFAGAVIVSVVYALVALALKSLEQKDKEILRKLLSKVQAIFQDNNLG